MNFFDIFRKSEQKAPQSTPEVESVQPDHNLSFDAEAVAKARAAGKKCVFNLIIVDESGSMSSIYQQALTGMNETLQTIREAEVENEGQAHFVTLVTFDTGHFNRIYNGSPAAKTTDLTENQYRPCGGTPLFDAMGKSITDLRHKVMKEDLVLVTVITDGYENASREYTCEAIKALVDQLRSQGWIFTYLGANQDVEKVAMSMSINNYQGFEATQTGANDMFMREKRARKAFFSKAANCSTDDLAEGDYFEGWDK